jgi:hypothetical protein
MNKYIPTFSDKSKKTSLVASASSIMSSPEDTSKSIASMSWSARTVTGVMVRERRRREQPATKVVNVIFIVGSRVGA